MKYILENVSFYDGSHWGLTDRYPNVEAALVEALSLKEDWTTRYYSSKKACATCKIEQVSGVLEVTVSVSDDNDNYFYGVQKPEAHTIEAIDKAISQAWDEAEAKAESYINDDEEFDL